MTLQAELNTVRGFGWRTLPVNAERKPFKGYKWVKDPQPWELGKGESGFAIVIPEGYAVVDTDNDEALDRVLAVWGIKKSFIPFYIKTPRGHHIWFKCQTRFKKGASHTSLGADVDLLIAGKSYAPAPGTKRPDGEYTRHGEWEKIPQMPPELVAALSVDGEGKSLLEKPKGVAEPSFATDPVGGGIEVAEGKRNDYLNKVLFGLIMPSPLREDCCYELGQSMNAQLDKPLPSAEVDSIVKGAVEKRGKIEADAFWVPMEFSPATYQKTGFRTRILEAGINRMGYQFRHNLRSDAPEIYDAKAKEWRDVYEFERDALLHACRTRLFTGGRLYVKDNQVKVSKLNYFDWTRADLKGVVARLQKANAVDPIVADYLDKLPEWDRAERIDTLFADFFEVGDTPQDIIALAGRSLMIGMARRCLEAGCKHDEMVVLVGPEGGLKSTFCQYLVPHERFFSDTFTFDSDRTKMVEQTRGKVLIEAAEMNQLNGKNREHAKAMLSATCDQVRLSYRSDSVNYPRRFVFIGTSNSERVLPHDPQGNRRFIPIPARRKLMQGKLWERPDMIAAMEAERDQIWAEALHKARAGAEGEVPTEMREAMLAQTRAFARDPNEMDRIDDYIEDLLAESVMDWQVRESAKIGDHVSDKKLRERIKENRRVVGDAIRVREKGNVGYRFSLTPPDAPELV